MKGPQMHWLEVRETTYKFTSSTKILLYTLLVKHFVAYLIHEYYHQPQSTAFSYLLEVNFKIQLGDSKPVEYPFLSGTHTRLRKSFLLSVI